MDSFNRRSLFAFTIRTFFIRLFYNYSNLFGEGLCYCIIPFFKKDNKLAYAGEVLKKHLGFFNTSEYLSGFALGIILNEEQNNDRKRIEKVKDILSSTLGSIGDNLVNKLILPIIVLISLNIFIISDLKINTVTVSIIVILLFLFNIFNFSIRYYGIKAGFEKGLDSIRIFKSSEYKRIITVLRYTKIFLTILLLIILTLKVNILLFF